MPKRHDSERTKAVRQQFGKNLRAALEYSGQTQAALAREIDVGPQTVSDYIGGRSLPSVDTLVLIAAFVGQSVSWLVGDAFHGRDTLEAHQKDLALRLGGERLKALAEVEDEDLWAVMDLLIKGTNGQSETKSAKPKTRPRRRRSAN